MELFRKTEKNVKTQIEIMKTKTKLQCEIYEILIFERRGEAPKFDVIIAEMNAVKVPFRAKFAGFAFAIA